MNEFLQQIFNGLAIGSVYTLVALGLTVVFGILGIAHFAHGSLAMFGGYLTFVFSTSMGLSFFASIAMAMPVGAVMGMLIERFAYRPVRDAPHINAFIIALGLTMMLEGGNLLLFGADQVIIQTPYQQVFDFGGIFVAQLRMVVIVTAVTLVAVVTLLLLKTKTGKSVRAVAQNRHAAVLMGVNVNFVSSVVFAISSALGVAAGALIGALLALAPGVGESFAVKGFAVLILGGLGSLPGAILGGLVLGVSESLAAGFLSSAYKDVISFLIMILVLLVMPQGLMGKK
ncbi:branched-chain amino acid ABC transporter permease [Limnohabitans sp. B9-3]|jgi:branched-chain amino acid transport system permease protein|uniref:branched-chain amino acid ABC transporter permease n=1 Tax=Limnohabitans sp. B9-3 TaxID=1100707 RepID=UPI000C1F8018|nr:branched-chain amino acid ABC transporter permease [Limnohabitans sp. B9-3]PIT77713.1 branched-chain amino acid ABC transporter permease [Limnohabitans sp. B9-3]